MSPTLFLLVLLGLQQVEAKSPPPVLDVATIKALAPEPGVYVLVASDPTPVLTRLAGCVSEGAHTATGLGGMVRLKSMVKLKLKEPRAQVRLTGQPAFYFVGAAPGLHQVVPLEAKKKNREMKVGEIRTVFDSISSEFPDRLEMVVADLGENISHVTIASTLAPGEYAVVEKLLVMALSVPDPKAGGPHVLAFGVDRPAPKKPR